MGAEDAAVEDGKAPAGAEAENLDSLKVDELKERCRAASLKVGGSKAELVARLQEHSASSSSKTESKEEAKEEAKEEEAKAEEPKKEEDKEEAKEEAKGDATEEKEPEAKVDGATEESPKKEAQKSDAKDEDMLAEDAEEPAPATESAEVKEPAEKSKGFADAESDAESQAGGQPKPQEAAAPKADNDTEAKEPPQKIAKTGRSRSNSASSGSRKGDHRKEPTKMGNPEDREKARERLRDGPLERTSTQKSLRRSNRKYKDEDMEKLLEEHDQDEYGYNEIDLSRNSIGNKGIEDLIGICKKCPDLRILKLFSNEIDDDGAKTLAELFKCCKNIEEMHLSHNHFTEKGVITLIEGADEELSKEFSRPLWLRIEHNKVKDQKETVELIESRFKSVFIGPKDRYKRDGGNCRIHLPFLVDRDREKGRGKGRDKGRDDRDRGSWRDNDRGRNRSPPRRRSPPRGNYRNERQGYGRDDRSDARPARGGRYDDRSRSPRGRDRSPPPRRGVPELRGRQEKGGGRGRDQSPPARRPEANRYESHRGATLVASQRSSAAKGGGRPGSVPLASDEEYSYEYSDESVEPPPARGQYQDKGRGRAAPAQGARAPPPRDNYRAAPRSGYQGSSVRMGPSGRERR